MAPRPTLLLWAQSEQGCVGPTQQAQPGPRDLRSWLLAV